MERAIATTVAPGAPRIERKRSHGIIGQGNLSDVRRGEEMFNPIPKRPRKEPLVGERPDASTLADMMIVAATA